MLTRVAQLCTRVSYSVSAEPPTDPERQYSVVCVCMCVCVCVCVCVTHTHALPYWVQCEATAQDMGGVVLLLAPRVRLTSTSSSPHAHHRGSPVGGNVAPAPRTFQEGNTGPAAPGWLRASPPAVLMTTEIHFG